MRQIQILTDFAEDGKVYNISRGAVPWIFMWPYRVEKPSDMCICNLLKRHFPHLWSNALLVLWTIEDDMCDIGQIVPKQ